MNTLILTSEDLHQLVGKIGVDELMDEMIDRLTAALVSFDENETDILPNSRYHYETPFTGLIDWMPVHQRGTKVVMKTAGYRSDSPLQHHLPTVTSTISSYNTITGHLDAMVDGVFLTALRTGAASAVASRLLAHPDSTTLGLVGCGTQAVTQLHAMSRLFDLRECLIFDIDSGASESFPSRVARICDGKFKVEAVALESVLERADILSVATSASVYSGPAFYTHPAKPHVHVNAVGADCPGKIELPGSFLQDCFVCPDRREQAVLQGECQQLTPAMIGPNLADVAANPHNFDEHRFTQTVFDSTGWVLEDQVALDIVLDHAHSQGIGEWTPIECISDGPRSSCAFPGEALAGSGRQVL